MKVTLSVAGKFQAFDLAFQLLKRNYLQSLITSYPKFEVAKYGIPKSKVRSVIIKEIMERIWSKIPVIFKNFYNPRFFISETFDRLASRKIPRSDIFVGWSGSSLHSLITAKKGGAITVLERGSTHIVFQDRILREEYERFGIKPKIFQLAHPQIIEKELEEYNKADYIAVPSFFVKKTFVNEGVPEKKLIHVPYGVDIRLFKQIPKKDNVFRIIFAGGLTFRKGTPYVLQSFSELNLPNSELLLIGAITEEIKPFLRKHEGRYKHLNYQPLRDLHKLFSQGSVFVLPSIEEGLALVQPMAMACGLPIIATPNTGSEDIIRDGVDGFIIPIRDVNALKEKLLYLYENPEICRAMGQSAKERVSTGFTWDDYGDKMVAAYENIVPGNRH